MVNGRRKMSGQANDAAKIKRKFCQELVCTFQENATKMSNIYLCCERNHAITTVGTEYDENARKILIQRVDRGRKFFELSARAVQKKI